MKFVPKVPIDDALAFFCNGLVSNRRQVIIWTTNADPIRCIVYTVLRGAELKRCHKLAMPQVMALNIVIIQFEYIRFEYTSIAIHRNIDTMVVSKPVTKKIW